MAWHGGKTNYFNAILVTLPDHKLAVTVLANSAEGIASIYNISSEALKLMLLIKTGIAPEDVKKKPLPSQKRLPHKKLKRYVGRYDTLAGLTTVNIRHGELFVRFFGIKFQLVPHQSDIFTLNIIKTGKKREEGDVFQRLFPGVSFEDLYFTISEIKGRMVVVGHAAGVDMMVGMKLDPVTISEIWKKRIGKYEVVNRGKDSIYFESIEIRMENDVMVAETILAGMGRSKNKVAIEPISDNEAIIMGLGRNTGGTINFIFGGGEEQILFSGYIFRRSKN